MIEKDKEIEKLAEEHSLRQVYSRDGNIESELSISKYSFFAGFKANKAKYTEEEFKQGCYEAWVDRYSDDLEREPEGFDKWYESYLKSLEK